MENRARGSLLTIGALEYDTWEKRKQPLTDITNMVEPETPRADAIYHEDNIVTEEIPTAPLKSEVKIQKALRTSSGKRLQFDDENSLQNIRGVCTSDPISAAGAKQPHAKEVVLAPPPMIKKQNGKSKKRYNDTGRKELEETVISRHPLQQCAITSLLQTPRKEKVPLLYGSNVTVDSPDPMSKYNSSHSSNVCAMAKATSTVARIMRDYDAEAVPHPSPDSVTDDIYNFSPTSCGTTSSKTLSSSTRWKGESISDVLRLSCPDVAPSTDPAIPLHGPRNGSSCPSREDYDDILFEKTVEDNIATLRRQRIQGGGDLLSRSGTGMGPASRVVRTGGGRLLKPAMRSLEQLPSSMSTSSQPAKGVDVKGTGSVGGHPRETTPIRKQMPTSRSLDTLSTPLLDHIEEENTDIPSSPILTKPTPPLPIAGSRSGAPVRRNIRLHPSRPSSRDTTGYLRCSTSESNIISPTNARVSISGSSSNSNSRLNGKTHLRSITSDSEICQHVVVIEGASRELNDDFAQEEVAGDPLQTECVEIALLENDYRGKVNGEERAAVCVSPIDAYKEKSRQPSRAATVSGCSRALMTKLLTKASRLRRKKSKRPILFSPRFESIPEDDNVELSIPQWLTQYSSVLGLKTMALTASSKRSLEQTSSINSSAVLSTSRCESSEDSERIAAHDVDLEYVEWLLSQGNKAGKDCSNTELSAFFESIHSNDGPLFKKMLANNANLIYGRDRNGNTALMISTLVGWRKGIKLLIKHGADVNAQNRFGNTCLHFAHAMSGGEDIQRYLVKKTASDKIRNERGLCCLIKSGPDVTITCSDIAMI